MNTNKFISYWRNKLDHDGSPAVGIGIEWDKVSQDSKVIQYTGHDAWNKIGDFYTPLWGGFDRTILKEWLNPDRSDYSKFINEEKSAGRIHFYNKNGLTYPDFCAFADYSGSKGILGDGSHRYIDCNYLIINGKDFTEDIKKCRLDIICLKNFHDVLSSTDSRVIDQQ